MAYNPNFGANPYQLGFEIVNAFEPKGTTKPDAAVLERVAMESDQVVHVYPPVKGLPTLTNG